jgi:plasmid stabilization system protein ParE
VPSRYKVTLTGKAKVDILLCAEYIFERSLDMDIALMWEASLYEHLKQLETFPAGYPEYEIRPYRKLLHGRYIALFRIDEVESEVIVCGVFHSARLRESIGPVEPES